MNTRFTWSGTYLTASLAVLSCGGNGPNALSEATSPASPPSLERLAAIDHDLVPGATGDDVRAVHDYLTAYGYFPNRTLAQLYPNWRPIVAQSPGVADVYDNGTAEAVRAFQNKMHLEATGIVDASTRGRMAEGRCGVPDGIESVDPSSKFSLYNTPVIPRWSYYTQANTYILIPQTDLNLAVSHAVGAWNATTDLHLQYTSSPSTPGIKVVISFMSGHRIGPELEGHLAVTRAYSGEILVNIDFPWSTATPTPAGSFDLESVLLHELGHALGLSHSSWDAAMLPILPPGTQGRSLGTDDQVAVSARYDTWSGALGAYAEDIGANIIPDGTAGSIWIISASDHSIWKWMGGTSFSRDSANGDARRIAVDHQGLPWVAAPWGVYIRSSSDPTTGTWNQVRPDCTTDVGVGHEANSFNKSVWIVGCDSKVYKWTGGTSWALDPAAGSSVSRIAVDSIGTPWIISAGTPYHRSSNDPNSGFYASLGGSATDIGVGTFPYAYRTTQTATTGGFTLELFDYQEQTFYPANDIGDGGISALAEWKWIPLGQSGVNVAVANGGDPWITKSGVNPNVFKTNQ